MILIKLYYKLSFFIINNQSLLQATNELENRRDDQMMGKENIIKVMLSDKVNMTPSGFVADELSPEQFADRYW
ncbi:hypothetical protein [Paenibacillus popilliae]|uniref:Uncharacterized protein n=1 Tax=Paenibacillus popilliae TaxID=78057 RepID=A0ABY3AKI6_PAEPP|nr:hypothetical protein [Paenibacillus sp. SDF0028]TQR42589.1 hypothetical protein C7Y44_21370 [Paenibacillus sp. SDF0028]